MTRWFKHRSRTRNDEGAILVFALIIVTTVALVVGTLLTRGGGSLMATVTLRNVAASSYAADAAANIAINDLRTGYGFGANGGQPGDAEPAFNNNPTDGLGCFGHNSGVTGDTDNLILNGFYPAVGSVGSSSAYVHCLAQGGTGQQGPAVEITKDNKAAYALITLGGSITNNASVPLKVHGGVYSNDAVVGQVKLDLGNAHAVNSCDDTTVVAPFVRDCNNHTPYVDPNYSADTSSVPALQAPPTTCTDQVAVFQPGYYDDVNALNAAVGLCNASWFKPGTYYFDFHNGCAGQSTPAPYCPTNVFGARSGNEADVWTIPNGKPVIGGTRAGVFATSAQVAMTQVNGKSYMAPGNCVSPLTDTSAQGVQFIFGADSQMHLDKTASMELCASYHSNRPPIELFGLQASTPGVSTPTAVSETRDISNGGSVVSPGAFINADQSHLEAGGSGATWTRGPATGTAGGSCCTSVLDVGSDSGVTATSVGGNWSNANAAHLNKNATSGASWTTGNSGASKSATLKLKGFAPTSTVPAVSTVNLSAAKLNITHSEPSGTNANVALVVEGGGGQTWTPPSWSGPIAVANTVSLTGSDLSSLQTFIRSYGYLGATVTYLLSGGTGSSSATVGPLALSLDMSWPPTGSDTTQQTTLTISGFAPSAPVPAGAILTGAQLHVTHLESTTAGSSGSVSLGIGGWSYTRAIAASTTSRTEDIPISGSNLDDLQKQIHDKGYGSATVSYTAKQDNGASTTVGPITLDLTYYLPVLRAQSGCVTRPIGSGGCSFLWTDSDNGNNMISMYMQGTTYVPTADVNLTLSNFGAQVMEFGLIARQMEFDINNGNPRYDGPVFQIPDTTYTNGFVSTIVQIEVHVCLGQVTVTDGCKSNTPALTSRVQIYDPTGLPAPPARQITPLSWSHST